MSDDKVTIGGAISYAWALWLQNWRAIWGVLAFYALATTVLYAGQLANDPNLMLAGAAAALVADFMTNGAVFRVAFAKEAGDRPDFKLGVLGVQWRAMEWRMLGASALTLVFFVLIGALAVVAVCAVIVGVWMARDVPIATLTDQARVLAAIGPVGRTAIDVVSLVVCAVILFFAVRLSLAVVASAVTGKVQVLRSWPLTRGHFLALFMTRLALWLPAFILGSLLVGGLGDVTKTPPAPAAAFAVALTMGVVSAGVLAPLMSGALAYFFRSLRTPA